MADFDLDELKRRMNGAVEDLKREFSGLRTGRASPNLLDPITVEAYGSPMPLKQVANINVLEPRLLSVQVWDKALLSTVEKAIRSANLGLNPSVDGTIVRVPVPELTEERRRELAKVAVKYAEDHRIAVRNVRRDGMDKLKRSEKNGGISKDELHKLGGDVQELTDRVVTQIDELLATKDQEIMQV